VHTKFSGFITACSDNTSAATPAYDKGSSIEFPVLLALHSHKKGIQIEVYDVSFHTAK
jgi:hypothetical protein